MEVMMREKFMTTLSAEAREKLKIISAKERRGMNTILEDLILNYYDIKMMCFVKKFNLNNIFETINE